MDCRNVAPFAQPKENAGGRERRPNVSQRLWEGPYDHALPRGKYHNEAATTR